MSESSFSISHNGENFLDQNLVKTQNKMESVKTTQNSDNNSTETSPTVLVNSEQKSTHECERCGRCFVSLENLLKHLQGHLNNKPYYCKFCFKRFTHTSSLSTHHRIHTGERPYKCKECTRSFTKSSDLQRHADVHKQKHFICFNCDKCYARESVLAKHLRRNECNLSKDGPFESTHKKQGSHNTTPNIIVETFKSETKKQNKIVVLKKQQKYSLKPLLNMDKSFSSTEKSIDNIVSTTSSTVEATKKKGFYINSKIITSKNNKFYTIKKNAISTLQKNTPLSSQTKIIPQNVEKAPSVTPIKEKKAVEMNKATPSPVFPQQPINANQTVIQLPKKTIQLPFNNTTVQPIILLQPQLLLQPFKPFILLSNTQSASNPVVKLPDTSPKNVEWPDIINDSNNLLENSFL